MAPASGWRVPRSLCEGMGGALDVVSDVDEGSISP
jgi:hypothetical protein